MQIIENPPKGWVRHLRESCEVWLTKERAIAVVVAPFTPPVGRQRAGRLFISRAGGIDYWFVSDEGKGIDGSTIMQPIEGSLPETPVALQSSEAEELRLEIAKLRAQIQTLQDNPLSGLFRGMTAVRIPLSSFLGQPASNSEEDSSTNEDDDEERN